MQNNPVNKIMRPKKGPRLIKSNLSNFPWYKTATKLKGAAIIIR
jgi:hypothetical protein